MNLSVVIVTFNSEQFIAECLTALDQEPGDALEVVIVDNASADGTVAIVKTRWPNAILIENSRNLGFAEACNQGIDAASGHWIATLNPDTTVAAGWLSTVRREISAVPPEVGMLQCLMYFASGEKINSTGISLSRTGWARDRSFGAAPAAANHGPEVFCPTAGAALYRRAMLAAVRLPSGVFDRGFFMYWEDVDLGWRCRLAGWEARYLSSAVVFHHYQGAVRRQRPGFAERLIFRNRMSSIAKNASPGFMLRSLPRTVLMLARSLARGQFRALPDLFRGFAYGFRQRRGVTLLVRDSRARLERRWAGNSGDPR